MDEEVGAAAELGARGAIAAVAEDDDLRYGGACGISRGALGWCLSYSLISPRMEGYGGCARHSDRAGHVRRGNRPGQDDDLTAAPRLPNDVAADEHLDGRRVGKALTEPVGQR